MELQKISFKSGKLVNIEFRKSGGRIDYIKIHGDFFMYPEESIELIERFLTGKRLREIKELPLFVKNRSIRIIGFNPEELVQCLMQQGFKK